MSDSKKKIGFVIGEKGKKYGLQVRASSATTAARKPVLAAFAAADASDESDDSANGRPVATSHASTRITQAQHAAALAADPTAFAYDEVLDDLHAKRKAESRKARKDAKREPKYVKQLLAKAEERKRDNELYFEKKLLREQAELDDAGTERFVTGAYRRKLEENARWREQQAERDAAIERGAVGARSSTALLVNLLNGRLAADDEAASSDDEDRKGGQQVAGESNTTGGAKANAVRDSTASTASTASTKTSQHESERLVKPVHVQHESERLTKPNNASAADEKDSAEVPSAKRAKADSSSATTATTTAATTTSTTSSTAAATASTAEQQGEKTLQEKLARGRNERVQTQAWDKSVVTGATVAERQVAQIAKPSKFDEKAVMSAKERYLARKRAREEAKKQEQQ